MNSPFTTHIKANEVTIDDLPFERLSLEEPPLPMEIDEPDTPTTPTTPMEIDEMSPDTPPAKRKKFFHSTPLRLLFTDPPDARGIIDYRSSQRLRGEFYSQYQNQGDSADSPLVLP